MSSVNSLKVLFSHRYKFQKEKDLRQPQEVQAICVKMLPDRSSTKLGACLCEHRHCQIHLQPQQFLPASVKHTNSQIHRQTTTCATSACPKLNAFCSGLSPAGESHHDLEKPSSTKIKKPSLKKTPNLPSVHSGAQYTFAFETAPHHLPAPFSSANGQARSLSAQAEKPTKSPSFGSSMTPLS